MLPDNIAFMAAFVSYFAAASAYSFFLFWMRSVPPAFATGIVAAGVFFHSGAVAMRWYAAGYPPMSNMYESLSVFSLLIAVSYLAVERRYETKALGPFVISIALTMIAVASVLPDEIKPLVPALRSYWLAFHVALSFVGEAAFAVSYAAAVLYILKPSKGSSAGWFRTAFASANAGAFLAVVSFFIVALLIKRAVVPAEWASRAAFWVPAAFFAAGCAAFSFLKDAVVAALPEKDVLDDISYRSVAAGLPVFTLGALVFGAIWAHRAWGSYWSWDPKEVWALITWFVYSIYLHMRHRSSLQGEAAAYVAALGFMSTLFTFFGVNYLLSGLHSYGRF